MSTPIDILRRARVILGDPRSWTQGAGRRDNGAHVAFCSLGAIDQAAIDLGISLAGSAVFNARSMIRRHTDDLILWNDDSRRTHVEVLALFDDVIMATS